VLGGFRLGVTWDLGEISEGLRWRNEKPVALDAIPDPPVVVPRAISGGFVVPGWASTQRSQSWPARAPRGIVKGGLSSLGKPSELPLLTFPSPAI
jgi:hypothetical protein